MARIAINDFKGTFPRLEPIDLPAGAAVIADNCKLWSGGLRAWKGNSNPVATLTKTGEIQTIYRFARQAGDPSSGFWFHWDSAVDVLRGAIKNDTQERTIFSGDGAPAVTDASIATAGGGTNYPNNRYRLGIPQPNTPSVAGPNGTPDSGADEADEENRIYVVTYISEWSSIKEEGPPCLITEVVEGVRPGHTVELTALPTAPAGNYNITSKKIYRSASNGLDTSYYLVAELPIAQTSFTDDVATESLGEEIFSTGYFEPPADIHSFQMLGNGILVGASGNMICPSEPYLAHAFDPLYQQPMNYPIVGIGALSSGGVILTEENAAYLAGSSPELLRVDDYPDRRGCVSKRGIVSSAAGVIYASSDGLVLISEGGGMQLLSDPYFTRDEWQALKPESIHACVHDDQYIAFYDNGTTQGGFIIDPRMASKGITWLDFYASAMYADSLADRLFMVINDNEVVRWDDNAASLRTYKWRSSTINNRSMLPFTAARVLADSYDDLTFKLYVSDNGENWELKHTETVASYGAFRLPGGYMKPMIQIQLEGTDTVTGFDIAHSFREIA